LDDLGLPFRTADDHLALITLSAAGTTASQPVIVERISEQLQPDAATMHQLTDAGLRPGQQVTVTATPAGVEVWASGVPMLLDRHVSDHIFVRVI
jgi:DtxR family Mn-dependent transcriptional regulator